MYSKYALVGMCTICRVGQNHIYIYIRWIYGIFGRRITEITVIYGVYIRLWPILTICLCAHTTNRNIKHSKSAHVYMQARMLAWLSVWITWRHLA